MSSSFSYRYFSMKCGYSSPNFLKLVIDGKRNISGESIETFSKFFKLNKREQEYFKLLVLFNQAKTTTEKKEMAQIILKSSVFTRLHPLAKDQYEYVSKWYYVAVRELLKTKRMKLDACKISKLIKPKLSVKKVEEILEVLLRINVIKRKDNRFVAIEELVTTGDEVVFSAVADYHRQMMQLASESIDTFPRELRDISGVTVGVSEESFQELKTMVQKFRKNVLELSEREKNKKDIYQLNIQLFPLNEIGES